MQSQWQKLVNNRACFWVSAAFIGPFALPLLWRDARYSRKSKTLISVVLVVLTAALLWGQYKLAIKMQHEIEALGVQESAQD